MCQNQCFTMMMKQKNFFRAISKFLKTALKQIFKVEVKLFQKEFLNLKIKRRKKKKEKVNNYA